jgi:hypothetical protein
MISNSGHYAGAADGGEGIPAPSPQDQDLILDAWHEALAQVLANRDDDWQQQLRAMKAESMAAIAELRANAAEFRSTTEAMIEKRLAQIREPADGPRGEPGPPGEPGPQGKLEIVKDVIEGQVYYDRDLVVGNDGALYQADRDTAARPPHADWRCVTRAGRDGKDALNFRVEGTYDSDAKYRRLSIVMLNGSSFVARHDDPGPCPGDGWQLFTSVGKRGQHGPKGERGERGPTGPLAIAPRIASTEIDADYNLVILYTDNSCNTIPLRPALEQFLMEAVRR